METQTDMKLVRNPRRETYVKKECERERKSVERERESVDRKKQGVVRGIKNRSKA